MFIYALAVFVITSLGVTATEIACEAHDLKALFVKLVNTEKRLNAKKEEHKTAFVTELELIKHNMTEQNNEVNALISICNETIRQVNESVQSAIQKINRGLDDIIKNMTTLAKTLDTILLKTDGGWSLWSKWTECSVTCGFGLISRTRVCNNPEPFGLGRDCFGNKEEVKMCNAFKCSDCIISSCKKVPKYSGTYDIYPDNKCNRMVVYCDQTTDGGGWIVIQRRKDGSVDFDRTWADYKSGFGDLEGEFWLGNDNIYDLTNASFNELRVDLADFEGNRAYAKYSKFSIKPESARYALAVSGYSGDAGDSLTFHNGSKFSTRDFGDNCIVAHKGGWWHDIFYDIYCYIYHSNLNGYYYGNTSSSINGIWWTTWNSNLHKLKFVEMKIS